MSSISKSFGDEIHIHYYSLEFFFGNVVYLSTKNMREVAYASNDN